MLRNNTGTNKASPTESPTASPTESPTASPTESPTASPTMSPTEGQSNGPDASARAYVFLLTNAKYELMTRKAIASLQQYDVDTPIVVMTHQYRIQPPIHHVIEWPIQQLHNFGQFQWKDTFAKFEVAGLTQFERVMFFDSDVLFYGSPRPFFDEAPDADVVAPYAYWLENGTSVFMSGGPLIVRPSAALFAEARSGRLSKTYTSEMDYFNEYAQRHPVVPLTNTSFVIVGEYYPQDPVYRYHGNHPVEEQTMIHFIADWKPPLRADRLRSMPADIQEIYDRWERMTASPPLIESAA